MGFFRRQPSSRATAPVEVSAEELREWFEGEDPRDGLPPTPYERAVHAVERGQSTNLVVVLDQTRVVATVVETVHGAVWRSAVDQVDAVGEVHRSLHHELLEWSGDRPSPLRLVASSPLHDEPIEVEPEQILREVARARAGRKVQRLVV